MENHLTNNSTQQTEGNLKRLDEKEVSQHLRIENLLNKRILKTMLLINDRYPELIKFVDEMSITIPGEKHPKITHKILRSYHKSLKSLVQKYTTNRSETLSTT